jgi:hypothetical protein
MLRVAGSLKLGWVTASLFIEAAVVSAPKRAEARLAIIRAPKQNDFHPALPVRRVAQRRIGTQINKGEALHALRGFLFVANEGQGSAPL